MDSVRFGPWDQLRILELFLFTTRLSALLYGISLGLFGVRLCIEARPKDERSLSVVSFLGGVEPVVIWAMLLMLVVTMVLFVLSGVESRCLPVRNDSRYGDRSTSKSRRNWRCRGWLVVLRARMLDDTTPSCFSGGVMHVRANAESFTGRDDSKFWKAVAPWDRTTSVRSLLPTSDLLTTTRECDKYGATWTDNTNPFRTRVEDVDLRWLITEVVHIQEEGLFRSIVSFL